MIGGWLNEAGQLLRKKIEWELTMSTPYPPTCQPKESTMTPSENFRVQMRDMICDAAAATNLREQLHVEQRKLIEERTLAIKAMTGRDTAEAKVLVQAKEIADLRAIVALREKQIEQLKEANVNLNRMAFPSRYYEPLPSHYAARFLSPR